MPRTMLRMVGGTDRETHMALELYKQSELTREGAKVVVEALTKCRSNMERFAMLSQYIRAEAAREYLQKYNFT